MSDLERKGLKRASELLKEAHDALYDWQWSDVVQSALKTKENSILKEKLREQIGKSQSILNDAQAWITTILDQSK